VLQALRALHLLPARPAVPGDAEGKVQIIDEYTGRVLPGRTWEQGLHQMIETKEGWPLSEQTRTLARITYQRFFRRYLRLAGMTGTGREVARGDLAAVYRLEHGGDPHRTGPMRAAPGGPRSAAPTKPPSGAGGRSWCGAAAQGQPVLVGTRSVEASENL
jgi:preprotein translocase subunit SecA